MDYAEVLALDAVILIPPAEVQVAIVEEIRRLGPKAWGQAHGYSPQLASDIVRGRRRITDELAGAAGYQRFEFYVSTAELEENLARHLAANPA